jgi:alpha,alpha-trehalase
LSERKAQGRSAFRPFDPGPDYRRYVDGKPRYDGVASFLVSRGISLPRGTPADDPGQETVCGLGNRKDHYFWREIEQQGVETFKSTVALIERLRALRVKVGIFSASRNAQAILVAAGVEGLFDSRVDGNDAERLSLPGKPHPAMLLELTSRLGATPDRTVVFEDAIAGVQAGRAGDFAAVIGINRSPSPNVLLISGADFEVADLSQIQLRIDDEASDSA